MTRLKRLGIVVGVVLAGGVLGYLVEAIREMVGLVCFWVGFPFVLRFTAAAVSVQEAIDSAIGTPEPPGSMWGVTVLAGAGVLLLMGIVGAARFIWGNEK